jgi:hypothetical protein
VSLFFLFFLFFLEKKKIFFTVKKVWECFQNQRPCFLDMMPLTKRMSLPLSPRQQNQLTRSPRSKRRISVDDVLCANLGHTAKSLCSPSHYATKRIDETAFDNNVENNREAETFLGGLLSEAPTPSRVARPITRQSQCLQGFSYSPADIMIDSRRQRRHASMPEKSSPRHLMVAQSPKGEKEKDGVNGKN